ncbi:hypothetical protein ACFSUS_14495 [Spirosoma soli]|uniref:ABC transporter permease n=1 Tax=Spirosoma soli TaxID=1770529 RepID=A0ABW5M4D9_9BACT
MFFVLYRTLVLPFYVRNAGTFLVVVLLAFGFLRPIDHEALITGALGSPFFLSIIIGLWGVYTVRVVSFVRRQLAAPEHLFLQTFRLVPPPIRWPLWLLLLTELLIPVIAYAIWMLARAIHYQTWGPFVAIVLTVLGLITGGAWVVDYRLRHHVHNALRLPHLSIRLPYELFFPTYWLRHEPLSLFLTKLISCLLLVGVCRLYPTDDYDQRLLLIGLMLALITHSQVSRQLSAFEQRFLLILPNLPLSQWLRLGRYVITYGLIWLPELLILCRNCPAKVRLDYVGWLWLTGWGWLLLLHSLAYGRAISSERWQTGVFWGFIIGLLAIMFGLPVALWLLMGWLGAIILQMTNRARSGH